MLKIGEFARVGQVSIVTLRHYDQCGLLKPHALDPESGYRYYILEQLPRLHRILAFKDMGFPLEQILRLLEENLSPDQLQAMFLLKQEQTRQLIEAEQARLARIAARLCQIKQEGSMPVYEILLKEVEPVVVASDRGLMSMEEAMGLVYERIRTYLDGKQISYAQPEMLLLHSRHKLQEDRLVIDVETAVPLSKGLPDNTPFSERTLPGGLMACVMHKGYYLALGNAYATLYRWLEGNNYQLIGPPRMLLHQRGKDISTDQYVTEVQFPIRLRPVSTHLSEE
ncbi:MerR family transcriptional regulator [Ktedonospora formicarum]|uniref:MerR family transcriptional regulator n=1 Tax=Ktedonospora formicarum TaxID=2778364 RepID=A0A8J3HXY7_9CHLR|nr:GyrI-like domain-containing protein [Ktedonospora formicarum]GHO46247.1 MerR family transcriptional regulator [Ktedonospora formicarum]